LGTLLSGQKCTCAASVGPTLGPTGAAQVFWGR
jgi:hypothetical protein